MDGRSHVLAPDATVRAIIDNLRSLGDVMGMLPNVELSTVGDALVYLSNIPFPLFNGVIGPRWMHEEVDTVIDKVVARAQARNVPMLWWLTPDSLPMDLGARLLVRGFHGPETIPGMAINLLTLSEEAGPVGLTTRRIEDSQSASIWATVACEGFGFAPWVHDPLTRLISAVGFDEDALMQNYVAYLGGSAVATATVAYAAGVAGIYNVATVPEARGRGIGRAITLGPLLEAQKRDCRVGILHASAMGLPVYHRLGFQQFCEIETYLWTGEATLTEVHGD